MDTPFSVPSTQLRYSGIWETLTIHIYEHIHIKDPWQDSIAKPPHRLLFPDKIRGGKEKKKVKGERETTCHYKKKKKPLKCQVTSFQGRSDKPTVAQS